MCTSGLGSSLIPPNEAVRESVAVGFVGTSLMQQCDLSTGGSGRTNPSSKGWLRWSQVFTDYRFEAPIWYDETNPAGWESRNFWGLNFGVSGQTIAQILDRRQRVLSDCKRAGVKLLVVDGGTNDVGTISKEDIQSGREQLVNYFLNGNITVVLLPILARDITQWPSAGAQRRDANWINAKTREFVKGKKNCYIFDWNESWVDFSDADGQPIAGYSNDGTHFDNEGAFAVGQQFATFIESIFPVADLNLLSPDSAYNNPDNLFGYISPNPYMSGTGGTVDAPATGVIPDGWRIFRSTGTSGLVGSKEVRADGFGDYSVLTITPTADTSLWQFRTISADTSHGGALAEKWVQAECDVDISAYGGWTELRLFLDDIDSPTGRQVYSITNGETLLPVAAWSGKLKTHPLRLNSDSTEVRFRFEIEIDGSAGSPVVKIGAFNVRQVADPTVAYGIGN